MTAARLFPPMKYPVTRQQAIDAAVRKYIYPFSFIAFRNLCETAIRVKADPNDVAYVDCIRAEFRRIMDAA